ncbi:MAG: septal ring lytic transglycosylase RlpA family protein [Rubrivivax sp.]
MPALLAACGSAPRQGTVSGEISASSTIDAQRDGPPSNPPPDLIERPDAQPRIEPIRSGGPNKPYAVLGQRYTPLLGDEPVAESGLASWYGRKFHGRPTASGEIYDMYAMSAAHRTMPIPSYARVRNPANGREVVVRINDRGPFHSTRVIDLSYAAALKLGVLRGVAPVEVQRLTHEDIRSGRWQAQASPELASAQVPVPVAVLAPAPAADLPDTAPVAPVAPVAPAALAAPAAPTKAEQGFWVQLGAFRQRQSAFDLRQQTMRELTWLEPWLAIFDDSVLFRVQAGPFASRIEAQGVVERIRGAAALQPTIVHRR